MCPRFALGYVFCQIMDEIHLLGEDRGPVLEVIVSRMRYIAASAARGNDSSGQRQVQAEVKKPTTELKTQAKRATTELGQRARKPTTELSH